MENDVVNVVPDPFRPYKAYAAVISAVLVSLISSQVFSTQVTAFLSAAVAGLAVFIVPNPMRMKQMEVKKNPATGESDQALF